MKLATFTTIAALLLTISSARADFSYTTTRKTTAGASVAGNHNQASRYYFKGRKMKVETGDTAVVLDFAARTITALDNKLKTMSVRTFEADATGATVDIKKTGQTKNIGGHRAVEMLLTTGLDGPELRTMGSQLQMEVDLWLSEDVQGAAWLHKFYQENQVGFPWRILSGPGNPAIQTGLASLHGRIATMNGIPALEVIKVLPAGGPPAKPLTPAESGKIRDTIAELDAKVQKGGPEAEAATHEMSRLKAMVGDDYVKGPLFEITVESSGFSTGSIPDSVFAIPAGYQQRTEAIQ
jgi:hypothetical protein